MNAWSLSALLLELASKATALLLLALAVGGLLRGRSAAARSWVWTLTFLSLALLPSLAFLAPPVPLLPVPAAARVVALPPDPPPPLPPPLTSAKARERAQPALLQWREVEEKRSRRQRTLVVPWAVGAGLLLLRSLLFRIRAARLAARARPAELAIWGTPPGCSMRESPEIKTPAVVGFWRPLVLVPATLEPAAWPPSARAAMLRHETAHLERRDPALQALAEVVCAIYWFHPLVWLAARQLRLDREIAADDAVIRQGTRPSEYADLLIELAAVAGRRPVRGAVVPILTRGGLKARLLALLEEKTSRRLPSSRQIAVAAFLCGCAGVLLAGAGASTTLAAARAIERVQLRPAMPARFSPRLVQERCSGALLGRVLDRGTGRPVAGAWVDLLSDMSEPFDTTRTGADGRYRFDSLPRQHTGDIYGLYARQGHRAVRQTVRVARDEERVMDLALGEPAFALEGRVLADGRPVAGAVVFVGRAGSWQLHPGASVQPITDADGRYRIEGLLPAHLALWADAPGLLVGRREVVVSSADLQGQDFHLDRPEPLLGVAESPDGRPLENAWITVSATTAAGAVRGSSGWVHSERDGSFLFDRAMGVLEVVATYPPGGLATPRPTLVRAGLERPLHVVLRPGAAVSGTIRWKGGSPAGRVRVLVVMENHALWPHQILLSGEDGRYSVGALPGGRYRIDAQAAHDGAPEQWTSRSLTLDPGERLEGVDLWMPVAPPR
jgi:beta-lactamase regulating signal transducer with metallopeptidase domain/protocatechuate 3,4-dioxygenase beta subunit